MKDEENEIAQIERPVRQRRPRTSHDARHQQDDQLHPTAPAPPERQGIEINMQDDRCGRGSGDRIENRNIFFASITHDPASAASSTAAMRGRASSDRSDSVSVITEDDGGRTGGLADTTPSLIASTSSSALTSAGPATPSSVRGDDAVVISTPAENAAAAVRCFAPSPRSFHHHLTRLARKSRVLGEKKMVEIAELDRGPNAAC